jgi:hypothetical protein
VRAGGLRHDRPLYIFLEIPQPPGEAAIAVRFDRADTPARDGTAAGGKSRLPADLPRSLVFERRLTFRPGRAILVTYDPVRRELTAVP